jgi:uncharacterized coiled-coil protein SlyX
VNILDRARAFLAHPLVENIIVVGGAMLAASAVQDLIMRRNDQLKELQDSIDRRKGQLDRLLARVGEARAEAQRQESIATKARAAARAFREYPMQADVDPLGRGEQLPQPQHPVYVEVGTPAAAAAGEQLQERVDELAGDGHREQYLTTNAAATDGDVPDRDPW